MNKLAKTKISISVAVIPGDFFDELPLSRRRGGESSLWVISGHQRRTDLCPLYPKNGHGPASVGCPLSAKSGHRRNTLTVRAPAPGLRAVETKGPGRSHASQGLKFGECKGVLCTQ